MYRRFSVLACLALAAVCQAQGTWMKMTPTNSPPSRTFPAMCYDIARQRTVLFGGRSGRTSLGDTWEWDGKNWTQMNPSTSPPARYIHTMAYDWLRRKTVLYGGTNGTVRFSDTWEWDGKNWTQVNTTTAAPGRGGHAMAFNFLIQRCVVLGGTPNGSWNSVMAGTWEYDGKTWAQANIATEPPARSQHAMSFDSALRKTLLFGGGKLGGTRLNDTWTWDGKVWTQLNPQTSPPARYWHAMSDDTTRQRVVMFGGSTGSYQADTWEWDGKTWAQITTSAAPSARGAHAMAYDSARRRTVLFGGTSGGAETWEYSTSSRPGQYTVFGTGCAGSNGVPVLSNTGVPEINKSFSVSLANARPASVAVLWFGARMSLAIGSCTLYASQIAPIILPTGNGSVTAPLTVPNDPALIAAKFANQWWVVDPLGALGGFVAFSQGGEGDIGG